MGCPYEEGDTAMDFLMSHTPYPRKISKNCSDLLGKGASADVTTCGECLKLGEKKVLKVGELHCTPLVKGTLALTVSYISHL